MEKNQSSLFQAVLLTASLHNRASVTTKNVLCKLVWCFGFVAGAATYGVGQNEPPYKFGSPSKGELSMVRYEKDTLAPAVILYDKGYFNGNLNTFTRQIRIKILTNAGTSRANFTIRSPSKSSIDGYTFNLENGHMVTSKLERANIFEEEIVNGFEVYKIFFPNVKPGSIIDLKYFFFGMPSEWWFQDKIPVVYNEIVLDDSRDILFKKSTYGSQPIQNIDHYRWKVKDVPAIVEEPYMSNYTNYVTRFVFDIQSLSRGTDHEISTSWEKIGQRLIAFKSFGGVINDAPFLNEKAREIKRSELSPNQKIVAAYEYIQQKIKWNGENALIASKDYFENFKLDGSGNSADINLLLISLLKKIGIKAYAVVLSTRDHGFVNPLSASLSTLNYVACYIKDNDIDMLLDATHPDLIPGILPVHCRNLSAWVIDSPGGWWLDLGTGKANSRKQYISIQPDSANNLIANVTTTHEDYDFLDWMKGYREHGSDSSYFTFLISSISTMEIRSGKVHVEKSKMRAVQQIVADLNGTDYVQDFGQEIIVNPFILNDMGNPFKSEKRSFPVDFVYPVARTITVSFKIPADCLLRKVPESFALNSDTGGGRFTFRSDINNNILSIKCDLKIEKQIFDENEYASLRNFFIEVNRKLSDPIILDKKI